MVKAIILDLDGTLIDSHAAHISSYHSALGEFGLDVSDKKLSSQFGKIAEDILVTLFPDLNKSDIKHIVLDKRQVFLNHLDGVPPLPFAGEFLKAVSAKYSLAIATSTSRVELKAILSKLGWTDYFKVLITSYDVKNPKPAPDILLKASELLGFPVKDCLFIGDTIFDALSAKSALMPFIGVSMRNADLIRKEGFTCYSDLKSVMAHLR